MRKKKTSERPTVKADEAKRIRVRMELTALREAWINAAKVFAELGESEIAEKKLDQARLMGEAAELI